MKAIIEELLQEVAPELREALEDAYEQGYRDGMAQSGVRSASGGAVAGGASDPAGPQEVAVDAAGAGTELVQPEAGGISRLTTDAAPPESAGATLARTLWGGEQDDDDGDDEGAEAGGRRVRRRIGIFARSTVGRLRERIVREFRLERFDLDVIICRAGDRDRRQLPSSARLQAYLREER